MSNKIAITDIVNRLESDMLLLTKQELYWQAKVMLHNFREKIDFVFEGQTDEPFVYSILLNLKSYLDSEEEKLNA